MHFQLSLARNFFKSKFILLKICIKLEITNTPHNTVHQLYREHWHRKVLIISYDFKSHVPKEKSYFGLVKSLKHWVKEDRVHVQSAVYQSQCCMCSLSQEVCYGPKK